MRCKHGYDDMVDDCPYCVNEHMVPTNAQKLDDLFELVHEPIRPVRKDVIGEVVFTEAWKRLMLEDTDNDLHMIAQILRAMAIDPNQRLATVLASVVCWLGTNCGLGFLQTVPKYDNSIRNYNRYVTAWSIENFRRQGVNSGVRTLEHCMLETPPSGWSIYRSFALPNLSADDYEAVEHLMAWFGYTEGQEFLDFCISEIDVQAKTVRDIRYAKWREENVRLFGGQQQ